jgi:hypothetical protein
MMLDDFYIDQFWWKHSINQRIAALRFQQREDGGWDYFPLGFRKLGYRVDGSERQRILEILDGSNRILLLPFIVSFGLGVLAQDWLLRLLPSLHSVFYGGVGLIVVVAVMLIACIPISLVTRRGARRLIAELLRGSKRVTLSEEEYRSVIARRWIEIPVARKLWHFIFAVGMLILFLWGAASDFTSGASHLLGAGFVVGAVLAATTAVRSGRDAVKAERWSRRARTGG